MNERTTAKEAIALFRQHGGMLRTSEALRLGIHPRTLYALRDADVLEQLARGLYRLVDLPPPFPTPTWLSSRSRFRRVWSASFRPLPFTS